MSFVTTGRRLVSVVEKGKAISHLVFFIVSCLQLQCSLPQKGLAEELGQPASVTLGLAGESLFPGSGVCVAQAQSLRGYSRLS